MPIVTEAWTNHLTLHDLQKPTTYLRVPKVYLLTTLSIVAAPSLGLGLHLSVPHSYRKSITTETNNMMLKWYPCYFYLNETFILRPWHSVLANRRRLVAATGQFLPNENPFLFSAPRPTQVGASNSIKWVVAECPIYLPDMTRKTQSKRPSI